MSRFNVDSLQGQEDYRRSVGNWASESREVVGAAAIAAMTAADVKEALEAYWQDELRQAETAREEGEYVSDIAELEASFKRIFRHEFLFLTGDAEGSNPTGWVGKERREQLCIGITATCEQRAARMQEDGHEVTAATLVDALREREASMIANFVYTADDDIRQHILEAMLTEAAEKVAAVYSAGAEHRSIG